MPWRLIGALAACLTSFAFVPQVFKMLKTKSARDVSCLTLIQLSCGVSLWIAYGVHLGDAIIISANVFTLVTLLAVIFLYFKYN